MSRPFHLAVPAGDLKDSVHFYEKILECKLGNREEGKWIDVDFWGNELTLHKTNMKLPSERHEVDMGSVPVPHFGVHLEPCLLYTSPSPRDPVSSRMPSSA